MGIRVWSQLIRLQFQIQARNPKREKKMMLRLTQGGARVVSRRTAAAAAGVAAARAEPASVAAARCAASSATWGCGRNSSSHGPRGKRGDCGCSALHQSQPFTASSFLQGGRAFSSSAPGESAAAQETIEFKAETRQLLDIVTHSIYTDKEVFLRELISNASDAMEKLRHLQVAGQIPDEVSSSPSSSSSSTPLEICISVDSDAGTLTIEDTGVGMTREELVDNLGTIARSGSKAFLKEMAAEGEAGAAGGGAEAAGGLEGIIGQFGVGFYSAFMVSDRVSVYSRSAKDGSCSLWTSDGSGQFTVGDVPDSEVAELRRGCKIVMHLKEGSSKYADKAAVEKVVKKYSNFVGVPIKLNGETVNTVEALWSKMPNEVDEDKYKEFYQFINHTMDSPRDRLHFRMDAPLELKALFFIPEFHAEKLGMGRLEPGVSLYCRKVLVDAKNPDILPEWLRFIRGVVDSEDLPLSLSRETAQDSALIKKLNRVLTRKVIRHLQDMKKRNIDKYKDFWGEYSAFLKEGACQDYESQRDIAQLLLFETNKSSPGELCSLDDYVGRCTPEQKRIYFLLAPDRATALASPYYEAFKRSGTEVIFIYSAIDDFVMTNLAQYNDRPLVTAETSSLDDIVQPGSKKEGEEGEEEGKDADSSSSSSSKSGDSSTRGRDESEVAAGAPLTEHEMGVLGKWLEREALPGKLREVRASTRLYDSPAIISSEASGSMRKMMRMLQTQTGSTPEQLAIQEAQLLEVNPGHAIVRHLYAVRTTNPDVAKLVAEQMFENAMVAAGMVDDSRSMLPRLNTLLEKVLTDDMALHKGGEEEEEEKA